MITPPDEFVIEPAETPSRVPVPGPHAAPADDGRDDAAAPVLRPAPGSVAVPAPTADPLAACSLLIELARALHACGTPSDRIESLLDEASSRAGISSSFFVAPTAIMVTFDGVPEAPARVIGTDAPDVDLGRMTELGLLVDEIAPSAAAIAAADRRLRAIQVAPSPYGRTATRLSFAGASGAAGVFLGASAPGALLAAAFSLAIAFGLEAAATRPRLARAFLLLAATGASATAQLAERVAGVVADSVALAALIVLLPGLSLTLAMRELAARNLVSGSARLMGTLADFLALAFGLALGERLVSAALDLGGWAIAVPAPWPPLDGPWPLVALSVAPLSFLILFRVPPRATVAVFLTAMAGFYTARHATGVDPLLAPMLGGAVVGIAGNAGSRFTRLPAAVFAVPGIMLLVPGALGTRSIETFMIAGDTLGALDTAVRTVLVGGAIATGLLAANAALPARGV